MKPVASSRLVSVNGIRLHAWDADAADDHTASELSGYTRSDRLLPPVAAAWHAAVELRASIGLLHKTRGGGPHPKQVGLAADRKVTGLVVEQLVFKPARCPGRVVDGLAQPERETQRLEIERAGGQWLAQFEVHGEGRPRTAANGTCD